MAEVQEGSLEFFPEKEMVSVGLEYVRRWGSQWKSTFFFFFFGFLSSSCWYAHTKYLSFSRYLCYHYNSRLALLYCHSALKIVGALLSQSIFFPARWFFLLEAHFFFCGKIIYLTTTLLFYGRAASFSYQNGLHYVRRGRIVTP